MLHTRRVPDFTASILPRRAQGPCGGQVCLFEAERASIAACASTPAPRTAFGISKRIHRVAASSRCSMFSKGSSPASRSPEPRFFRSLLNARYGNLQKAKTDATFILKSEPNNPSYRALAAYIAALSGDKAWLQSFDGQTITDSRALGLLGEAAYLIGDHSSARSWWAEEAKTYPLGASLAYWAGKKHLVHGQRRVAEALLEECVTMATNSKQAKEAEDLLASGKGPE